MQISNLVMFETLQFLEKLTLFARGKALKISKTCENRAHASSSNIILLLVIVQLIRNHLILLLATASTTKRVPKDPATLKIVHIQAVLILFCL